MRTCVHVKNYVFAILFCTAVSVAYSQASSAPIKLWPDGAPGLTGTASREKVRTNPDGEHIVSNIQQPSITPYFPPPARAPVTAVLVIPGGGHRELWIDHEGYAVAQWLSSHGVAAFVLEYRLAREEGSTYTVEGTSLGDTQRAIRTIRARSREWGIDPQRIGVIGFSAGGELAALASTRYDDGVPGASDAVERLSSRPNFQGLLYPAIPKDLRLTAQTPPAFMACGSTDEARISQGSAELYLQLAKLHVSTELHIYAGVGHGFGIRKRNPAPVSGWPDLFLAWLNTEHLLTP